jgi:hypothetical protein
MPPRPERATPDVAFPEIERQLQGSGEDPRDFRRLHRDLAALFQPHDVVGDAAVQLLAAPVRFAQGRLWWEKARRIRTWVAAGPAPTNELDARIDELPLLLVSVQRRRHERWRPWPAEVLGPGLGSPAEVRREIERRLFAFRATKAARTYPRPNEMGRPAGGTGGRSRRHSGWNGPESRNQPPTDPAGRDCRTTRKPKRSQVKPRGKLLPMATSLV